MASCVLVTVSVLVSVSVSLALSEREAAGRPQHPRALPELLGAGAVPGHSAPCRAPELAPQPQGASAAAVGQH